MLKKTIISLVFLLMCQIAFANPDCILTIKPHEDQGTFGNRVSDRFVITVKDKNYDIRRKKYHRVSYEIISYSDSMIVTNKLKLKRVASKVRKDNEIRFTGKAVVHIVAENGQAISLNNLPVGLHFVKFELQAHCQDPPRP